MRHDIDCMVMMACTPRVATDNDIISWLDEAFVGGRGVRAQLWSNSDPDRMLCLRLLHPIILGLPFSFDSEHSLTRTESPGIYCESIV